jgi:outer membrane protein assembly factor BamE (lipoprotein component of BamABCDE complex)
MAMSEAVQPRILPMQFGLRSLFLVMAGVALLIWLIMFLTVLPRGHIWQNDLGRVAVGMTKQDVFKIHGQPLRESTTDHGTFWIYHVADARGHRRQFVVLFVDDQVKMRYMHWGSGLE